MKQIKTCERTHRVGCISHCVPYELKYRTHKSNANPGFFLLVLPPRKVLGYFLLYLQHIRVPRIISQYFHRVKLHQDSKQDVGGSDNYVLVLTSPVPYCVTLNTLC